jgi:outer membrane protein assembly factor BamB
MKKKIVRIIIIAAGILVLMGGAFGYFIWNSTQKSEDILGKREAIPQKTSVVDIISKGNSDWNTWQGPNFDKKSSFTGLKKNWSKGLTKLWEVNFLCQGDQTASWATAVIQGNVLIVPGRDEKSDLVFCLNSETGELIWKGSYLADAKTNHGPGSRATPAIDNDRVYTFGRSGDLVCWNLTDGKILWHKNVVEIGGEEPDWGHSSSPLVFGNKVIVQSGGKALAAAYDKITGEVLWTSGKGVAGYAAANIYTADSTILLFSGEALSEVDPENGSIFWSIPWVTDYKVNAATPVSEGNIVFATSGYGMGSFAVKIENKKATKLWESKAIESQHSDPVIVDGYVYGYAGNSTRNNGKLACLRLSDGKVMWQSDEAGMGTFAYADGHLICLDIKGNLYLVETNPNKFVKSGEVKGAIPNVKYPAWTAPVVANGKLYLRYLQNIICYDIQGDK